MNHLSVREIEILRRLVHGDSNKQISRRVEISETTVKVHVKAILRKLGVRNRTQAAIWGLDRLSHGPSVTPMVPSTLARNGNGSAVAMIAGQEPAPAVGVP
jgi:two-component system nitrate/nitrite response regulator NarL